MSKKTKYRLKDSTAVEPLVNGWSAWSHVLSPVAASLHLKNYQLELLRAYLQDPSVHIRACQDPKLRSGRFVDIPSERANEVSDLLREMERNQSSNIQLAQKLIEFHNYLVAEAKGLSLDPYYQKLPTELCGYVELSYDYYNRPMVRCLEGLLYESHYYDERLQSLRLLQQTRDNSRSFFMSTPRLPDNQQIDWATPFASQHVDRLFGMDAAALPLGEIREMLGLSSADEELLLTFLAEEAAQSNQRWTEDTIRIRYFGHACVLLEWNGISVLTDPCIGLVPTEEIIERFSYRDLPDKIDYALVTHNHHDHYCLETLLRLRHRIECLVVPRAAGLLYGDISLKRLSRKLGFKHVIELDALESINLSAGEIISIPFLGEHADLAHGKTAYVVRAGNEQILFAADSDCLDQNVYGHVRRSIGRITTVFIGMECVGAPLSWSCGPFLPYKPEYEVEQSRRYKGADSARAMRILEAVGAERLYIYAMGLEPWLEHLLGLAYTDDALQLQEARSLLRRAGQRGLTARLLAGKDEIYLLNRVLQNGSTLHIVETIEGQVNTYLEEVGPADLQHAKPNSSDENDLAQHIAYWKKHLDVNFPLLNCLVDHPAFTNINYRQATHSFTLPGSVTDALKRLDQQENTSPFTILLMTFQTLLYRYTGQDQIVVATNFNSSRQNDLDSCAEISAKFLPFCTDMTGNPGIKVLLRRVCNKIKETESLPPISVELVLESLGNEKRARAAETLFQVMFLMNENGGPAIGESHADSTAIILEQLTEKAALVLSFEKKEAQIEGTWVYNANLFDPATIEEMAKRYQSLLEKIAANEESIKILDIELDHVDQNNSNEKLSSMLSHSPANDQFAFD